MKRIFILILLLLGLCQTAPAQLKDPGKQAPGKNFWYGLTGRDSLALTRVWMGSLVVPGYSQAYNRDYWKIPVVWGGIGGLIAGGVYSNNKYHDTGDSRFQTQRNWCYIGAIAVYWGSLLDGLVSYNTGERNVPSRATLYSAMLPGLGQAYNGEYWKIPIFYGGLAFTSYLIDFNNTQYNRYRTAFNQVTHGEKDEFNGRLSADKLRYYRDDYRRSRDYAILFTVLVYALNIIDANVFAYLKDFDVSDDLSFRATPGILNFDNYASRFGSGGPAFGMQLQFTF